jgi:hypothetical protein
MNDLSVIPTGEGFTLAMSGHALRTRGGNVLQHSSQELMELIADEIRTSDDVTINEGVVTAPVSTSALSLLIVLVDVIRTGNGVLATNFRQALLADPVLYTIPGPEQVSREATYQIIRMWMDDEMSSLQKHVTELQSLAFLTDEEKANLELSADVDASIEHVEWIYSILSDEQKAIVNVLLHVHDQCLLLAMSLVLNPECYASDYADGVIAAHMLDPEVFTDVPRAEAKRLRATCVSDALAVTKFLACSQTDDESEEDDTDEVQASAPQSSMD